MINASEISISVGDLRAATAATAVVDELSAPLDHLFASKGKRLRAALVQGSAKVGAHPATNAIREGAVAVELLHLATLAHDDVVDDGEIRRGRETLTVAHGNRASAFAGVALVAAATDIMAHHGQKANQAFADSVAAVCMGEMAEVEDLFDVDRSTDRYWQAVAGKTAAGFAFGGWIGAWLAGASGQLVATTRRFGRELGMAFQVLDDILDLCGPPTSTGKEPGKDLKQGVYTLPVLYAVLADPSLKQDLGHPIDDGDLDPIIEKVFASGGVRAAEEACRSLAGQARAVISGVPNDGRDTLLKVLDLAVEPLDLLTDTRFRYA
jgi:heptaprenyl diphosphate synthase